MQSRRAYVHEATLELAPGIAPAAVGAAVTVALCGHYEHDGACRWPHNSSISSDTDSARFRTLFVAPGGEEPDVRARIENALRKSGDWTVIASGPRPLRTHENGLAERLARMPPPAASS